MVIGGFIYFSIFILIYIAVSAYAVMWSKHDKEKASIYYIIHSLSSILLMFILWIGYLIFHGDKNNQVIDFKLMYIIFGLDIGLSVYTWFKLNPFFKSILKEYGDIITYKKPCNELSKKQRILYGCYKPTFNVLLLVWQIMFSYFSITIFINFIISSL